MFVGDFFLFRFVGMWPWDFFLGKGGEASPVGWRRWCGFRDVEVVVRRSRRWDVPLFTKEKENSGGGNVRGEVEKRDGVKEEWLQEGKEGKLFGEKVLPAVNKWWVRNKTSYQMLDQNWDLYFSGMIEAQALVDEGKNKMDDFRTSVLVHTEKWGWLVWEVWREQEEGTEDEGTNKLQLIKDRLTVMGKENLFFRWIEVVQSETSQPGPFTAERYVIFDCVSREVFLCLLLAYSQLVWLCDFLSYPSLLVGLPRLDYGLSPPSRKDTLTLGLCSGRRRRYRRLGWSSKNVVLSLRTFGRVLGEWRTCLGWRSLHDRVSTSRKHRCTNQQICPLTLTFKFSKYRALLPRFHR